MILTISLVGSVRSPELPQTEYTIAKAEECAQEENVAGLTKCFSTKKFIIEVNAV